MFSDVSTWPGKIVGALGDLGNLLGNAGKSVLDGFLNGLQNAWTNVQNFVGGIASWIAANKGPIEFDRQLLVPHGNAVMDGFHEGLKSGLGRVMDTVKGVAGGLSDAMDTSVKVAVGTSVTGGGLAATGAPGTGSFSGAGAAAGAALAAGTVAGDGASLSGTATASGTHIENMVIHMQAIADLSDPNALNQSAKQFVGQMRQAIRAEEGNYS